MFEPKSLRELAKSEVAYLGLNGYAQTKMRKKLPKTVFVEVQHAMLNILETVQSAVSEKRGFIRKVKLSHKVISKLRFRARYFASSSTPAEVKFHSWTNRRLEKDMEEIYLRVGKMDRTHNRHLRIYRIMNEKGAILRSIQRLFVAIHARYRHLNFLNNFNKLEK